MCGGRLGGSAPLWARKGAAGGCAHAQQRAHAPTAPHTLPPCALRPLQALLTANLSANTFSGLLPSLPAALVELDVSRNQFGGQLPAPLPSSLITLRADHNKLSGGVPPVRGCRLQGSEAARGSAPACPAR